MPSLAAALLTLSMGAHASDALKTAFTAEDIAGVVTNKGHANQIEIDSTGDPIISARNPLIAHDYQILFYNCHAGQCGAIQIRAWFKHTAPISAEQINAWNSTQTFGRVFLDKDGDPNLDVFIYAHSGVTMSYVSSELTCFLKVMRDFRAELAGSIE